MHRYYVTFRDEKGYGYNSIFMASDLEDLFLKIRYDTRTILDIELLTGTDWVQLKKQNALRDKVAGIVRWAIAGAKCGDDIKIAEQILDLINQEGKNGNPSQR